MKTLTTLLSWLLCLSLYGLAITFLAILLVSALSLSVMMCDVESSASLLRAGS